MTAVSVLYGNNADPHSQRARLALAIAGIHCELREVDSAALPPAIARLPLLQLPNGKLIDDSFLIALWACERRPQLDLWPSIRVRQQSIENLVRIIDGPFAAGLDGYRRAAAARPNLVEGRDAQGWRFEAEMFLAQLEARLARMAYLVGDRETLADIAVLPFIQQFADLDRTWFDVSPYRQLRAWLLRYRDNANWLQASRPVARWHVDAQPIYLTPTDDRRASG